MHTLYETSSQF